MKFFESKAAKVIEGYGIMLGMIIGAGIFGLPFAFSKAPFYWNLLLFVAVFGLSLLLHYIYAGIIYITPGKHRFPGYVKRYLGHRAETIAAIFTVLSSYGAMLAYGILGAIFLEIIFGLDLFMGGIIFFVLGGLLFSRPLAYVGRVDFYLSIPLLLFILYLAFRLLPISRAVNFSGIEAESWFFSYGILVFAMGGYSGLPDLHDLLGHTSGSIFKRIIFWSLFASALLYLLFIFTVVGVSGQIVSEDAITGLGGAIGREALVLGALIGIFTVFRSYTTFGADLKLTYQYDYGISKTSAWLLAFTPPITLFISGLVDLVKILSLVGSVGLGVFAIFILSMAWHRSREISLFLNFKLHSWILIILAALFVAGALQDIIKIF
jgi:amino acid permease